MVLLHLCSPTDWRTALDTGVIAPPSLNDVGFVHLSTPEQVELPAQRLFAGRRDLVLLAVDPDRLDRAGIEVHWEPGVPGDPESMRFPHAYGAVPADTVLGVLPYLPGDDGRFAAPAVPPLDDAGRARSFQPSVLRRAAGREVAVTGGVAVITDSVPVSRMHNRLLVHGPVDAATVVAESDRVLGGAGLTDAAVTVLAPGPDDAGNLRALGWSVEEQVTMCARTDGPAGAVSVAGAVEVVDLDDLRPLYDAGWRAGIPALTDAQVAQLTDRHRLHAAVVDVTHLAVREDGRVVAGCLLERDGATAWLDSLETDPAARRRGHGAALVRAAVATARAGGCDLVALDCVADDWPREWYGRLGFREVGRTLSAVRA